MIEDSDVQEAKSRCVSFYVRLCGMGQVPLTPKPYRLGSLALRDEGRILEARGTEP